MECASDAPPFRQDSVGSEPAHQDDADLPVASTEDGFCSSYLRPGEANSVGLREILRGGHSRRSVQRDRTTS